MKTRLRVLFVSEPVESGSFSIEPLPSVTARLQQGLWRYEEDTSDIQIRDGLVKRFEFTYELSTRIIKRFLEHTSAVPHQYDEMNFADIIRSANELGLLAGNWLDWRKYRDMRNRSSHTYNEDTAKSVVADIPQFLAEAQFLCWALQRQIDLAEGRASLNVRPEQEKLVRSILRQHIPQHEVWAFGSRIGNTAKPYSDLDLVVMTQDPLSNAVRAALTEAFSDAGLPWKVDVVDWSTTNEAFREHVRKKHIVLQAASESGPQ